MSEPLLRRLALTTLAVAVLAGFPSLAATKKAAPVRPATAPAAQGALPDDMTLGNPAAKVTVVEYASVGCPVCALWGKTVYPAFKAKYIDTGKVRFVYREMLVGGTMEQTAAAAGFVLAHCVPKAKYFDVIEALYRDQEQVFKSSRVTLLAIGKGAGLTDAQFNACLANEAAFNELYKRAETNGRVGKVDATPTFVVNGKSLEPGAQPLTALEAAIAKAG